MLLTDEYTLEMKLDYEASLIERDDDNEPSAESLAELNAYFDRIEAENAAADVAGFLARGGSF